jgi:hypothetical protein
VAACWCSINNVSSFFVTAFPIRIPFHSVLQAKMELSSIVRSLVPLLVVVIAIFFYQRIYQKHWYVVKGLDRSSFDKNHAKFNPIHIPMTFYHRGRLNEVVSKVSSDSFSNIPYFLK